MILVTFNDNFDEILFDDTVTTNDFYCSSKDYSPLYNIPLFKNYCTFRELLMEIFSFCVSAIIFLKF